MNYKKLTLSIALFLLVCFKSEAQGMPEIIPPSPQSVQFFKQFEFPANNPNGTINYSIPIYEVKSGSLSLPISLSYVSGGTKITDEPGEIGLGWSLNAGGRIARTIYGRPDGIRHFPDEIPVMNNGDGVPFDNSRAQYLDRLYLDYFDSEFDIYSYSFGNTSGKFLYNQYDEPNSYTPHFMPEKPYKIFGGLIGGEDTWNLVDDKGITYIYGTEEQYKTSGSSSYGAPTAKYLNYMISADKKDTIRFEYQVWPGQIRYSNSAMAMIQDNNTVLDNTTLQRINVRTLNGFNSIMETLVSSFQNYEVVVPTNIYFKGGKIAFTFGIGGGIEYVKIYGKSNNLVKQFQLVQTGPSHQRQLSELRLQDISGTTVEKYSFEYYPFYAYEEDHLGYIKNGGRHVFRREVSQNYWHYYNDFKTNHPWPATIGAGGITSYESDATSMWGMLKKVTYPTGGSAEYSYELNRSFLTNHPWTNNGPSGGMRLAEAKLTDNNGNVHYKTYKYGITGEEGYGALTAFGFSSLPGADGPSVALTAYETRVFPSLPDFTGYGTSFGQSYRKRVYTSSFLPEVAEAAQQPTVYPTVTVYDGTPTSNTGKTVYKYNRHRLKYEIATYPAAEWWRFVAYSGWVGEFGLEFDPELSHRYHIQQFNPWISDPLESTTVYKNNGSGYDVVKSIVNNYNIVETKIFRGLHFLKNVEFNDNTFGVSPITLQIPYWLYDNYYVTTGREDLTSTTETLHTATGNIVTTTEYEYNSNHQVNKITRTESKGGTNITTYTYSNDYPSTQPYTAMVTNNMISQPIEQSSYKNSVSSGNFLQSTKTDYKFWLNGQTTTTPNNSIYPQSVWTKTGTGSYEQRLSYHSYDNEGNITSVSKENDVAKSYIWGYNQTYPVAEFVNVSYSDALALLNQSIIQNPTDDAALRTELNKIRTTYPSAQVTTYTYKPLIGMTSATDANNRTTYYIYDNYGRLTLVKDKDGNILKKYCYNYQGQQENCNLFTNAPLSGDYYSQNCPPGETAVAYNVSLPADMFVSSVSQADANTQAQQYAQSLANQNGTCTAPQVTLQLSNYTGNYYYVSLVNTQTNVDYGTWLFAYEYDIPLAVPEGTYNIFVSFDTQPYPAYIGACGYSTYGTDASFYNVTVNYQNRYITMQD